MLNTGSLDHALRLMYYKDSRARFRCPFIVLRSKRISDDVAEMALSVADEEPDREGLTSSIVSVGVCVCRTSCRRNDLFRECVKNELYFSGNV